MLIPTENSATTIVAVLASLNMANKLSRSCTRSFSLSLSLSLPQRTLLLQTHRHTELACTRLPREVRSFPRRPDVGVSLQRRPSSLTYRVSRLLDPLRNPEYSPRRYPFHESSPDENEQSVGPLIGGISRRVGWRQPRIFRTLRFVSGVSHPREALPTSDIDFPGENRIEVCLWYATDRVARHRRYEGWLITESIREKDDIIENIVTSWNVHVMFILRSWNSKRCKWRKSFDKRKKHIINFDTYVILSFELYGQSM